MIPILLLLLQLTLASPTGSPTCIADPSKVISAMNYKQDTGYTLKASSNDLLPGTTVDLQVTGGAYTGILLYCEPKNAQPNDKTPQAKGSFDSLPDGIQAVQNACNTLGNAIITHKNPSPKNETLKYTWKAPNDAGQYECKALIVFKKSSVELLTCDITVGTGSTAASGSDAVKALDISTSTPVSADSSLDTSATALSSVPDSSDIPVTADSITADSSSPVTADSIVDSSEPVTSDSVDASTSDSSSDSPVSDDSTTDTSDDSNDDSIAEEEPAAPKSSLKVKKLKPENAQMFGFKFFSNMNSTMPYLLTQMFMKMMSQFQSGSPMEQQPQQPPIVNPFQAPGQNEVIGEDALGQNQFSSNGILV